MSDTATNENVLLQIGLDTELYCSQNGGSNATPKQVLANKVVLLYFSAHWCGRKYL